jgi:hypothetical protein
VIIDGMIEKVADEAIAKALELVIVKLDSILTQHAASFPAAPSSAGLVTRQTDNDQLIHDLKQLLGDVVAEVRSRVSS